MFINKIDINKIPKLEQPDYNKIDEIEFQTLYSLGIHNIIIEYDTIVTEETKGIITNEIPKYNQD